MSVDHNKPLSAIVEVAAELMVCSLYLRESGDFKTAYGLMVGKNHLKWFAVFTQHCAEKFA